MIRTDRSEGQGSGGQGSLVCCSPWGHKELETTEQLNWWECTSAYLNGPRVLDSVLIQFWLLFLNSVHYIFSFEFICQDMATNSSPLLSPGQCRHSAQFSFTVWVMADFTGQAAQMTTWQLPPQPFHKCHTYNHVIKHASNTFDSQLSLAHISSAVQQLDHVNENHQTLLGCLFSYFYNLHQENLAWSNRNNPTWFV